MLNQNGTSQQNSKRYINKDGARSNVDCMREFQSKQRISVLLLAPMGTDVHNRHLTRLFTIDWFKNGGQLKLWGASSFIAGQHDFLLLLGHA